ncbi:MAG: hypothetical protein WCL14_04860 [Bacteroidota bacterium]
MGCGEKAKPFRRSPVTCKKPIRSYLPSKHSPDSSGSPLLCFGFGDAAATADSGTQMEREDAIGSLKELGIKN